MAAFGGLKENCVDGMASERSVLAPWFVARSNDYSAEQVIESATETGLVDVSGSLSRIPPSDGDAFRVSLEFVDENGREVTSVSWDARFIDGIRLSVRLGDSALIATLDRDGQVAVMTPSMRTLELIGDRPAAETIASIPDILRELPLCAEHHAALESLPNPAEMTVRGTDFRAVPVGVPGSRAPGL